MAALSAPSAKSRKLRSFIVVVFFYFLFYTYIRTSGKVWSNFGRARSRIANALTVFHYDAGGRWRHLTPFLMLRHSPKRKVFLASRLSYHRNSTASFNLTRLALCGDINPSPGPGTSAKTKTKCKTCERTIARNHRTVQCQE